jgi:hypothetical protein
MAATLTPVNPLAGPRRRGHVIQVAAKNKEREERLAAALRDNLRRRKAQARAAAKPEDGKAEE